MLKKDYQKCITTKFLTRIKKSKDLKPLLFFDFYMDKN